MQGSRFDAMKRDILARADKSREGRIDAPIRRLVGTLNRKPDYVTTSSCAGRIVLVTRPASGSKKGSAWVLKSHAPVRPDEVAAAIGGYSGPDDLWFLQEGFILHAACRTIDAAGRLIGAARDAGFKRSGIISMRPSKIMVELLSTEYIDAPVAVGGTKFVDKGFLELLVGKGNERMRENGDRIRVLEKGIEKI
ncbi:hypothetical protein JXB02_04855 [Candidatus Woesearchaeota archaeon]|nr:hypothetical protein [Candidatus Woesearchaeota archaeon]